MITHPELWQKTDLKLRARQVRSHAEALRVFNTLYREARLLGIFPPRNPLQGLETDIELAAALNLLKRRV